MFNRKAVFLDRDGTVIRIISRPDHPKPFTAPFFESELSFVPDVFESIVMLKEAGFMVILITNQPDPRHGYMSEAEWEKIHNKVMARLYHLDDFFICRHMTEENCPFKKPSGLMLQVAADKHGIDLSQSYMIGDSWKDMAAGRDAGCRRVIMLNAPYNLNDDSDDVRADSLKDAVEFIIRD